MRSELRGDHRRSTSSGRRPGIRHADYAMGGPIEKERVELTESPGNPPCCPSSSPPRCCCRLPPPRSHRPRPRSRWVWVLSTGGTIAGTGSSPTDLSNYRAGTLLGQALVDAVPQIRQIADVKVEQLANVNSSDITLDIWLKLAQRINRILADDPAVAGVVVTHGTNTLEETAYFLNLTVKSDRPVVLVGSMRPATAISADGPLNLLNAVRTAIARDARGKGALIVMNDEINGARDVTKTNTFRVETFRSPELGALGYVDEDKVAFYRTSTRRHTSRRSSTSARSRSCRASTSSIRMSNQTPR